MTYTESDYGTRSQIWFDLISGMAVHFEKLYSWPAQLTILRMAKKWKGLTCSLRTLNRDLKRMVKEGWFRRVRRITRKGINAGRFTSTLYILGRKAFKAATKMRKLADRILSFQRLPNLANNKSQRENKIFKEASGDVEKMWNPVIKGGASPIKDIL